MSALHDAFQPPFCPNDDCLFHKDSEGFHYQRYGTFDRSCDGRTIQRYRCVTCRRSFSSATFEAGYWMKRRDLLVDVFKSLESCSCFRQIARFYGVSKSTIARMAGRLGRHAMLFHEEHRPKEAPDEPLDVDGLESFEFSQYTPVEFHLGIGGESHFTYGFTESELRRKGRMTASQKKRRAALEASLGRPDPKSRELEMAALLKILVPPGSTVCIRSDENKAYPRAIRRLSDVSVRHETTSSKAPRTPANPLFSVNLADLLVRHCQSDHKRETIAFAKRRASSCNRMWIFVVWRNYVKWFSENKREATAAMRAGVETRKWEVSEVLDGRLFPHRVGLPERWWVYYRNETPTRQLGKIATHRLKYAF